MAGFIYPPTSRLPNPGAPCSKTSPPRAGPTTHQVQVPRAKKQKAKKKKALFALVWILLLLLLLLGPTKKKKKRLRGHPAGALCAVCPEGGVLGIYLPHAIANTPVGHFGAAASTARRPGPHQIQNLRPLGRPIATSAPPCGRGPKCRGATPRSWFGAPMAKVRSSGASHRGSGEGGGHMEALKWLQRLRSLR
jgi:hypothetical protein